MRALVCRAWGEVDGLKLENVEPPVPKAGEVLIEVRATPVNFADLIMVRGQYQTRPDFPFSPGLETSGVIARCGVGVTSFRPGDPVMALLDQGGMAEQTVAEAEQTWRIPDGMGFEEASVFPVAYLSSHVALRWQGRLEPGETLLVLGAAGGVGLSAVEIGKALGARVIAAASSDERLAAARAHGADELVNYGTDDLKAQIAALTDGRGVDVCFDPVGGSLFDQALSSIAWGGRILLVGFVGGIPQIPANRLLVKHRAALGSSLRYFRVHAPEKLQRSMADLLAWYGGGRLKPLISARYPLERAVEALRSLTDRRAIGKVVVCVAGDPTRQTPGSR